MPGGNSRTLTITVNVNSANSLQQINALKTALRDLSNPLGGGQSSPFAQFARDARDAANAVNQMAQASARANQSQGQATRSTSMFAGAARDATAAQKQYSIQQAQLFSAQQRFRFEHDRSRASLTSTNSVVRNAISLVRLHANTVRTNSDQIREWRQHMDDARRNAYAYTIAGYQMQEQIEFITSALKTSTEAFAEFDFAVRRAAGAFSVFDTEGQLFADLNKNIQDTAIATKLFDPTEIAKGYYYWGSTTGQVVKATEDLARVQKQVIPIMQLAAITESNLEASLKGVYSILQQYDLPMEKANEVTEKLFLVTQKTALEFPDLIESFKMVGPIAASIGVSFEDVIGILGALGNAGVRGSMAGRALRQTFIKLTDPTVRATKALDEAAARVHGLGTTFEELTFPEGEFVGMQKYLDILNDLTKDLTQAEKNRLLGIMTTNNELPSLIKLLDANAKSYQQNKVGIIEFQNAQFGAAEASNYFARAVENQMKSAAAVFGELGNVIKSIAIEFGRAVFDVMAPALQMLTAGLKGLLEFIREHPLVIRFVAALGLLAGALGLVAARALITVGAVRLLKVVLQDFQWMAKTSAAIVNLAHNMSMLQFSSQALSGEFAMMGLSGKKAVPLFFDPWISGMKRMVAGLGQMVAGLGQLVTAFRGLNLAMKSGVLIAVFIAIAVAMELMERHGKELGKAIGGLIDAFDQQFTAIVSSLADTVEVAADAMGLLADAFNAVFDAVGSAGATALEAVAFTLGEIAKNAKWNTPTFDALSNFLNDLGGTTGLEAANNAGTIESALAKMAIHARNMISVNPLDWFANVGPALKAAQEAIGYATSSSYGKSPVEMGFDVNIRDAPWRDEMKEQAEAAARAAAEAAALEWQTTWRVKMAEAAIGTGIAEAMTRMMTNGGTVASQRAAAHSVVSWAAGYVRSFEGTGKEAINAAFKAAQSLMLSKGKENRKVGQAWMAELAKGLQSGNAAHVATSLRTMMSKAVELVNSTNPKMREQGYSIAVAIGNGLKSAGGIDEAMRSRIDGLVRIIQDSGMPEAARQEAVATLMTFLDTFKALDAMAAKAWNENRARLKRFGEEGLDPGPYVSKYKDLLDIAKGFSGVEYDTPKSTSGGSGGEKAKSPLEKALEVAKNAAEMAQALKSVDGMDVKAMVKKSMGGLAQAMLLADQIVAKIAKQISTSTLQKVAEFSEATEKVASLINSAVEAFSSLESYKRPPKSVWSALAADIKYAVDSIGKIASMTRIKMVAQATVFAEYAGAVIELIGQGFEAFASLGESGYTRVPQQVFADLASDFALAVDEMARAVKGIAPQIQKSAKEFSENAGSTVELIGSGFAAFMELTNYSRVSPDTIANIVADIGLAMTRMGEEAKKFLGKNVLANIQKFAETASAVVSSIKEAIDAFSPQKVETGGEDYQMVAVNMAQVMNQIVTSVTMFAEAANSISPKALAAATKVAQAAKEVAEAIKGFVEIKGDEEGNGSLATFVQQNLNAILASLDAFASAAFGRGASIGAQLAAGLASQKAAIQAEVNAINALMSSVAGSPVSSVKTTTTKGKTEVVVTYNVTGNVSGMTASQVVGMLKTSNGVTSNAVSQAAGTK